MKNAVIDVGSNSVRLLFRGEKRNEVTQLAEDLLRTYRLREDAIERTVRVVKAFADYARGAGAGKVYAFATEAVRAAKNGDDFSAAVREVVDSFEVLSPEQEACLGFYGAYDGKGTVAVLDVGGASSELAVGNGHGVLYTHSLPLGAVRLKEYSPEENERFGYAQDRVREYGIVPPFDRLISIGGCVSVMASAFLGLEPFDPDRLDGFTMTYEQLFDTVNRVLAVPEEERDAIKGLNPKRKVVGPVGAMIALAVMEKLGVSEIVLSEKGNMEGYAAWREFDV